MTQATASARFRALVTSWCVVAVAALLPAFACSAPNSGELSARSPTDARLSPQEAIRRVLQQDTVLGKSRNEASKQVGVGVSSHDYAEALRSLDYDGAPDDFRNAFLVHANAWRVVGDEVDRHPEFGAVRGEMHEALDEIYATWPQESAELKRRIDHVWATWGDVETIAGQYGASD